MGSPPLVCSGLTIPETPSMSLMMWTRTPGRLTARGRNAQSERDQDRAGDGVEHAADAIPLQQPPRPRRRNRIRSEPEAGEQREEQPEREQARERCAELR